MADIIESTENVAPLPPENSISVVEVIPEIVIDYTKTSEDGTYSFSDAIRLPSNHVFTEVEIEAMKQERFDSWLSYILGSAA